VGPFPTLALEEAGAASPICGRRAEGVVQPARKPIWEEERRKRLAAFGASVRAGNGDSGLTG